jgi:hypothetical protein
MMEITIRAATSVLFADGRYSVEGRLACKSKFEGSRRWGCRRCGRLWISFSFDRRILVCQVSVGPGERVLYLTFLRSLKRVRQLQRAGLERQHLWEVTYLSRYLSYSNRSTTPRANSRNHRKRRDFNIARDPSRTFITIFRVSSRLSATLITNFPFSIRRPYATVVCRDWILDRRFRRARHTETRTTWAEALTSCYVAHLFIMSSIMNCCLLWQRWTWNGYIYLPGRSLDEIHGYF